MDIVEADLIDSTPLKEGWGVCYQGPSPDSAVDGLPSDFSEWTKSCSPVVIVCMDPEANEQFVDHKDVIGMIYVGIDDSPDACLSDAALRTLADSAIAVLNSGVNLYIHCAAGISRASYMDCAIHQRAMGWDFETALTYIRKGRPVANPNPGFAAQLTTLGAYLNEGIHN